MDTRDVLAKASAGHSSVPQDWMRATAVRPFVFEDPILAWLEVHGETNGFQKDSSPYEFTDFIFRKGRQFEAKWISEMASEAVPVCEQPYDVRDVERLKQTIELIQDRTPVIAGPALWWAPERVFGVPDLLVSATWLHGRFSDVEIGSTASDPYFVFDMKFTTELDSTQKRISYQNYTAQVRIYSYIVGQMTGVMPDAAFLICRDRITNPLKVSINSSVGVPLDRDLAEIRDRYLHIKLFGADYRPGIDKEIEANLTNDQDFPWHSAKIDIANNRVPGGDARLVYEIGNVQKDQLSEIGYSSRQELLASEPEDIPIERCSQLGAAKCPRIRAILQANRTGAVIRGAKPRKPPVKEFEFFVDFETFNNLNVDFDTEWPTLAGHEMIFMIGVGREVNGKWEHTALFAESETHAAERRLLAEFERFIKANSDATFPDASSATLVHWTSAEVWQLRRAADRHNLEVDHTLRRLPWYDLQKEVFLAEPIGVPGAWGYGLKKIATSLGLVEWPGSLDDGLRASVAGWKAYESSSPFETQEMHIIQEYNDVDCRALYEIAKWLRS